MIDIILTGVGGQGSVLAAKILSQAASNKGWQVRTAETIGMAQRGGSVISHVRMGDSGEEVYAPVITHGTADVVIAFEPGEAARVLPYLSKNGVVVTATTPIEPVTASLAGEAYDAARIIAEIEEALEADRGSCARVVPVDDAAIIDAIGGNRKVLNTVMLASAVANNCLPLTLDDLRSAIMECVKPRFVDLNIKVIENVSGNVSGV